MPVRRPLYDYDNDFPDKNGKRVLVEVKCVREITHDRLGNERKKESGWQIPEKGKTYHVRGVDYDPKNGVGLLLEEIDNKGVAAKNATEEPSWPYICFDRTYEEGELLLEEI